MPRTWSAVLARSGVPTGDGRILAPTGGSSRGLPLPLSYQAQSGDGHGGSVVVGRIETVSFGDGMVLATGSMLDAAYGTDVIELLENGVIGPSVDLDDIEYVMDADDNLIMTQWRVAGATLVAIPAFADVSLTLDPLPAEPMPSGLLPIEPEEGPRVAQYADDDCFYALQASAAPVRPPLDWFGKPDLPGPTPVTVSDTGRVFGHIATWGTCHVGLPGCVTAPFSASNYAYFLQGEQACEDGTTLPVGTLTYGGGHADASLAHRPAQSHYDDVGTAVAKVMAGEDEFGIWVAGWMLPDVSPEAAEGFRSSPVSGDWRRIGGALEMIAVCSVNAAGFPVPRARVNFSSGHQRTLIASFGITPVAGEYGAAEGTERARWAWQMAQSEGTN